MSRPATVVLKCIQIKFSCKSATSNWLELGSDSNFALLVILTWRLVCARKGISLTPFLILSSPFAHLFTTSPTRISELTGWKDALFWPLCLLLWAWKTLLSPIKPSLVLSWSDAGTFADAFLGDELPFPVGSSLLLLEPQSGYDAQVPSAFVIFGSPRGVNVLFNCLNGLCRGSRLLN